MGFMKTYLFIFFVLATCLFGCVKPPIITPASQANAEAAIDREKARAVSESIVADVIKGDRAHLRSEMEKGFRDYYDEKTFSSIVDQMFAMYGKALDAEYKMDGLGRKTGTGGYDKPMRKFWYAVGTTKHEKGTVYLTVEVVPDGDGLASSGVSMVTFPLGIPDGLK